jgi:hypothetical protein
MKKVLLYYHQAHFACPTIPPNWWKNFVNGSLNPNTRQGFEYFENDLYPILEKCNIKSYIVISDTKFERYLEFDSNEDFINFVLRWS